MSEDNTEHAICIVSPHEKGFWQADVYLEGWWEGAAPDGFCTGKKGGTKEQIILKVKENHPDIKIIDGITGICSECAHEHFNLEEQCEECGWPVHD